VTGVPSPKRAISLSFMAAAPRYLELRIIGDAFDYGVFAEVAVGEKLAGVAVEDFDQRRQDPQTPL